MAKNSAETVTEETVKNSLIEENHKRQRLNQWRRKKITLPSIMLDINN